MNSRRKNQIETDFYEFFYSVEIVPKYGIAYGKVQV